MRYLAVVLMVGLTVATTFLEPPGAVEPRPAPGTEDPPVAICPVLDGGNRATRISVLSSVNGEGRLSIPAGEETRSVDFRTGSFGAVTIEAADAGAVGATGALIEMPSERTAAASIIAGPGSLAAESCVDIPSGRVFISGGSTISGSRFDLQLINPYAGEAMLELTVTSESGIESDERFSGVIVPALSSRNLNISEIIPGRERISVNIETTRGSVLAFGRQTIGEEVALWRAVAPGDDWWLPVPPGGGTKQMLISNPESVEVPYQVDLYGSEGLVEAHAEGVIEPRGSVVVPLAAVTSEAAGVRVIAPAGPVVPALRIDSPQGLAWTTASQVTSPLWLMPGARSPRGGSGSAVILNTGLETITVSIRSLEEQSIVRDFELQAEGVLVTNLRPAEAYRIEATGPVAAIWTSQLDGAGSAAIGIPLVDE